MIRLRQACLALVVAILVAVPGLPAQAAPAALAIGTSSIELDSLTPATIPTKGTLVLTGSIHNGSSKTWHHLSIVPQNSFRALHSSEEVARAAAADPSQVHLGQTMQSLGVALKDLAPGHTAQFTVRIPRTALSVSGESGVYWLGVQPVSDEGLPEALTARTFLPLLPSVRSGAHVNIAMVVPLRANPLRSASGELADSGAFTTALSSEGRLGRIAAFGQAAGTRPLTWLVDPALLDLVDDRINDATAYSLGVFGSARPSASELPSPSESASSSASPSANASPTQSTEESTPATLDRLTAQTWMGEVTSLLKASTTFAMPYADPAVGPLVATGHADLIAKAFELSGQSMSARGLASQAAVAPASGSLSRAEWNALAAGDTAFAGASSANFTSVRTDGSRTIVVASAASIGGPGPSNATSAFNLRQRILADASLRVNDAKTPTLTVVLPANWNPGSSAGVDSFFPRLTARWLRFTNVPAAVSGAVSLARNTPGVTARQRANLTSALSLRTTVTEVMGALAANQAVTQGLFRRLSATEFSTMAAGADSAYAANAAATSAALTLTMASVKIEGTSFVTLSGSSGVITVSMHNGLNVPVRVGVRQIDKTPHNSVTVASVRPISLDPGERSTLRIRLSAARVSVQEVTLSPVTASGVTIGAPLTFTVRSSDVGTVVWAITIAIGLMIVVILGRGLRRRWKARQDS